MKKFNYIKLYFEKRMLRIFLLGIMSGFPWVLIGSALTLWLKENDLSLKVIIEARNIEEIKLILKHGGADRILIDNFGIQATKMAVSIIGNQCQIESSGGIDEVTLRHYAECGVDFISSGALTHSVHNLDLSLKVFK